MMKKTAFLLAITALAGLAACGKLDDTLKGIDPPYVATQFFETWKKKDWKALYGMTDPSFMRLLRTQRLSPELQRMSDEELFIHEFEQVQRLNPDKVLKSYKIQNISSWKKGDTTLWLYAAVNGKNRKIAMTLDGLSLKIDLTRIE